MSGSVNKVTLLGNLGRDPEIRSTQTGTRIANFSIATSESWKDRTTGERKERTEWHNVVVFNEGLTGIVEKYLKKGSKVYVEGALQTRKWTDNSGQERYTTEVVLKAFGGTLVLLGDGSGNRRSSDTYGGNGYERPATMGPRQSYANAGSRQEATHDNLDDDIPF